MGQQDLKKNPHLALQACAILKQRGVPFQFVLAGDGPDRHHLEAMTKELGIAEDVVFAGRVTDRKKLMALYRRSRLFVFPSLYDNAPMVVREAAMMETPSLVIEGSCAAEGIRHGENGFICQCSPESIAEGIMDALPRCEAADAQARKTIPIPWENVAKMVEARYRALIEKKKQVK